jgi:hypothetical protein
VEVSMLKGEGMVVADISKVTIVIFLASLGIMEITVVT